MTASSALLREDVRLADGRSYPVVIGPGAISELSAVVPPKAKRAAIVTQANIGVRVDPGIEHRIFTVPDGEQAKTLTVLEALLRQFAAWGLTRNDVVVAVGGGVVTDLGGFAAATYHRGMPVVHVSTTLLGQIDAAIGGKCGVNLPEGKNLVGAFWQPSAVLCDTDVLATLSPADHRSGLGELAKYHFLRGDSVRGDSVREDDSLAGRSLDDMTLPERIAAAVRIKADVVAADEREGGRRAILNYGHTLAHALETSGGYQLRHGEAVAVGLVYAAELARILGRIDGDRVAVHRRVVEGYGLSTVLPDGVDHDELIRLFGRDKKALDGVTFVLERAMGNGDHDVEVVGVDDIDAMHAALDSMHP